MTPRLEGSEAKRDRAKAHLESLERLITGFIGSNPYPIIVNPYPDRGRYEIKVVEPKPFPAQDIALMIGDCVHNMRCALDYLAWEFAGADPADRETMFPIFSSEDTYKRRGAWRIKKLPPNARALIEHAQPYKTRNPKNTALWAIDHLDAADKHRLLTVTVPITGQLSVRFRDARNGVRTRVEVQDAISLEKETIIATVTLASPIQQMKVEPKFTPQIAFGDDGEIGRSRFVIPNLQRMLRDVDKIIARFAALL